MIRIVQTPDNQYRLFLTDAAYQKLYQYGAKTNQSPQEILNLMIDSVINNITIMPQLLNLIESED